MTITQAFKAIPMALALTLAGCASSGGEVADGGLGGAGGEFVTTTEEVMTTTPPTTEAPTTEAPTTTVPPTTTKAPSTTEAPTTTEFDLDNELLFAFSMAAIRDDSPGDIYLICSTWVTLNFTEKWLFVNDSFASFDISVYPGWTQADVADHVREWFDAECAS